MLFNSYTFLFGFLPIALVGYQIAGHFHRKAVVAWLGLMSIAFYAYWRPPYVLLLLASIALNYLSAALISRHIPNKISSRIWLWLAIVLNLGVLGYFKYFFPLLNFAASVGNSGRHWSNVVLPLGISFFTFTQIAYLVDLQQGIAVQEDLSSYILFVSFFPHLIAGPILHHKDMMPQFRQDCLYRLRKDDLAVGFSWFIMGLGKKVLLADTFASTATLAYAFPGPLPALLAWRGLLCYALQLYFDFSGYSDMALGLARMFSIDFPLNFASPYKSTSIIDFWQRWHITLTNYIMAYVYSPLQFWISRRRQEQGKKVSRKAQATPEGFLNLIALPTLFTLFVAGLWHGAGWKFIIYGLLHGVYITVNHAWRIFRRNPAEPALRTPASRRATHVLSVLVTFLAVMVSQAFFRAADCSQAVSMIAGLCGFHGRGAFHFPAEGTPMAAVDLLEMAIGFAIVWGLPNTQQILSRFHPSLHLSQWDEAALPPRILWLPSPAWAIVMGCLFFAALVAVQNPSTFLYFQF